MSDATLLRFVFPLFPVENRPQPQSQQQYPPAGYVEQHAEQIQTFAYRPVTGSLRTVASCKRSAWHVVQRDRFIRLVSPMPLSLRLTDSPEQLDA